MANRDGVDFNFYLNRQGPIGRKGEKGDTGYSPVISIKTNNKEEFILTVQNEFNSFDTPNLKEGFIPEDRGGTYVRLDQNSGLQYYGPADVATTEQEGVIRIAQEIEIQDRSEGVAITPSGVQDIIDEINPPNRNEFENLQMQVASVESVADTNKSDIITLRSRDEELSTNILDNKTAIQNLESKVISDLDSEISIRELRDTEIENALHDEVADRVNDVSNLQTQISNLPTKQDMQNIESKVDKKQNKLIEGKNINITSNPDGTATISASGGGGEGELLPATSTRLGGVKIGSGVNVAEDGTISINEVTPPTNMVTTDTTQTITGNKTFNSLTVGDTYNLLEVGEIPDEGKGTNIDGEYFKLFTNKAEITTTSDLSINMEGLLEYNARMDDSETLYIDTNVDVNGDITKPLKGRYLNNGDFPDCITNAPHNIDVSLNSSNFIMLNMPSKVIVPYGTSAPTLKIGDKLDATSEVVGISWDNQKLFYTVEVTREIGVQDTVATTTDFIYYHNNSSYLGYISSDYITSGSEVPTSFDSYGSALWYDTTNNIIKRTTNSGATWTEYHSFPFAIASSQQKSGYKRIDQVFQHVGYMGNTIWAVADIAGYAPNGRNKNTSFIDSTRVYTNYIKTLQVSPDANLGYTKVILDSNHNIQIKNVDYDRFNNYLRLGTTNYIACTLVSPIEILNGKITKFEPIYPPTMVEYDNIPAIAAHSAMPSNRSTELTLGASGDPYAAPADGYVFFYVLGLPANGNIAIFIKNENNKSILGTRCPGINSGTSSPNIFIPVLKGQTFVVSYTSKGTSRGLFFTYAEGAY